MQPLADPVWGPALRRHVRGRRGTQADALAARALLPSWCPGRAGPANPVRAARLRPALCAHPVRRLPGAPAGRTSTRLGAGSPPPLSAEGTRQAKAAACWLPAGMQTPAVTSAFARREHTYRARRAAGSAEVDDQAQNVRWRNPASLLLPRSNANQDWTWRVRSLRGRTADLVDCGSAWVSRS